ncbi:MAG: VVA0879 family protein [Rhodoferax sp.]|uniref:VVA0879 family protein n=1 Tax=Rhodoferax sp. TaxID=50421 RepID=UPI002731646A|nr:VVA0879 family protein [Rhodoferax sp.]MDP1530285.1 VVA0879 family protein [Rhodoferax sp.]MDP1943368.1 VVA0879 family protein [Rhodoferax sp.]
MKTMTVTEFHGALIAQGVKREDLALICPMCQTVQSATDLIAAGAGSNFDEVEKYLGFSCVGRFTGAGTPRKDPDGAACNWTLGGLFALHKLEVVTEDGKRHPRFEPATPDQAMQHALKQGGAA